MNHLISVVVPIYNVEKYLPKCIESIIKQTYKNIEILLINDGSTDGSLKICNKYKSKDERIKIYTKENGGLSDARNYGIKKAKGSYICFIDSDDWIDSDFIEFLYNGIINNDCDISICNKYIEYEDGNTIIYNNTNKITIMDNKQGLVYLNSFKGFDMSACDKMFKISLFDKIKFPYGKKCEDLYTIFKLFEISNKIIYFDTPKYHYFQRNGSITRNNDINSSYVDAAKYQLDYFKENCSDILYAAETMYVFSIISNYNDYIRYNIICPKSKIKEYKKEIRKHFIPVIKNKELKASKKIQLICFLLNVHLYKMIFKIMR